MTTEKRKGRQTPTQSVILPYTKTRGQEAAELYENTGGELFPWQKLLLFDAMAINDEDLWTHQKFGWSVPRRNGKSESGLAICLWALREGLRVLYTAHRTSTSHAIWERLDRMTGKAKIPIKSTFKAFGKEHLHAKNGGVVEFRTRTSSGGLGEGYDILIVDEAQEYTEAQETSLKYIVSDSSNPLTIMFGTPPTVVSCGTVFSKFRETVLSGSGFDAGWAEWSVEEQHDPNDVEAWYETNPSLGYILTERTVRAEITNDDVDFNIQRLGLWLKYNQKSAISKAEWEYLKVAVMPKITGKLFVGIKFGHDNQNVAMSIAVKTSEKKIFIESIDCRPIRAGMDWILDFLMKIDSDKVVIDGANGQTLLEKEMKDCRLKKPLLPKVKDIIAANTAFELGLSSGTICHNNQPSLAQSAANCEKRAIGSNGGTGYRSIKEGVDVTLLESAVLAYWQCSETKEVKKKQRVSY